jgi:hypothetical protein
MVMTEMGKREMGVNEKVRHEKKWEGKRTVMMGIGGNWDKNHGSENCIPFLCIPLFGMLCQHTINIYVLMTAVLIKYSVFRTRKHYDRSKNACTNGTMSEDYHCPVDVI